MHALTTRMYLETTPPPTDNNAPPVPQKHDLLDVSEAQELFGDIPWIRLWSCSCQERGYISKFRVGGGDFFVTIARYDECAYLRYVRVGDFSRKEALRLLLVDRHNPELFYLRETREQTSSDMSWILGQAF